MKKQTIIAKNREELENDVQRDLTYYIILNLRHHELAVPTAQALAREFLAIFPIQTIEDLLRKLEKLAKKYHEARAVFIEYANAFYREKKKEALEIVPGYIKNLQIEEAIKITKGVTYHV